MANPPTRESVAAGHREEGTLASKMQRNSRRENMMTKATIALAALFLAVGTAAQAASDGFDKRERQGLGYDFHTGPLGQPLGDRQPSSWWADSYPQAEPYVYVPRHERIRRHHPIR
jgi:hypothetical protein